MSEGIKISQLTDATVVNLTDTLPIVQSGTTLEATVELVKQVVNPFALSVASKSANYTVTGPDDDNSFLFTTGASDLTLTLPAGSSMTPGDTIDATKVDSGAGKLIVSRAGSDTIDGVTTIDIDSQYDYAKLRWSGAHWTLVDYKDHGSGSTNNWERYADGTMRQWAYATAIDASPKVITFEKSFVSPPSVIGMVLATNRVVGSGDPSTVTATDWDAYVIIASTGASDTLRSINWTATGRWRA
jgi:hypothetical protein